MPTAIATITPPTSLASGNSAKSAGTTATVTARSTQPGTTPVGDFASLLDQLGQQSPQATNTPTDPVQTTPVSAAPNLEQTAAPGQPQPASLTPSQVAAASRPTPAAFAGAAKRGADAESDVAASKPVDDETAANELPTPAVVAPVVLPPAPPPLLAFAPLAGGPSATPASDVDPASSNVDATPAGVTVINLQADGLALPTAGPAGRPADALVAEQAAAVPQGGRSTARVGEDNPAGSAPATRSRNVKTGEDQPVFETSALPVIVPEITMPASLPGAISTVAQQPPTVAPLASAGAEQSTRAQPGSPTSAQSARVSRAASPATTAAPPPPSPPAFSLSDIPAATNSSTAAPMTASALGTTGAMTSASASPMTKPAEPSAPPSPATQVAQALAEPVKVLMSRANQAAITEPHITTIQITPIELGRVDIRIERTADGPAKIQFVAERPETLSRLVHDQAQLQQALDQAGVSQSGRTLDFSLAPPPIADTSASSSFLGGNTAGGSSSNEQHRQGAAYANRNFGAASETTLTPGANLRSIRAGIDITA